MSRTPRARRLTVSAAALIALAVTGCVRRPAPLSEPTGGEGDRKDPLVGLVVPIAVRSFDISGADGRRAVFFKLSRVPDSIAHRRETSPARVVVDVYGPATGDDLPTEAYPGADALVSEIQMTRTAGKLEIALHLATEEAPPYEVRQMADWLMVSFDAPR